MRQTQLAALVFVVLLVTALVITKITESAGKKPPQTEEATSTVRTSAGPQAAEATATAIEKSGSAEETAGQVASKGEKASPKLPRVIDLGSVGCIPCKMMAPILEELKKQLAGKVDVEFIDVNQSPAMADKYGIQIIPTQIFFDATGKELFRHEGFYPKSEILAKWRELGVDVSAPAKRTSSR